MVTIKKKENKEVNSTMPSENNFRKISTDKYIIAGVITLLIFGLGLTLGMVIDNYRYNVIEEVNMEQEVRYLSLQSQYLYLTSFGSYNNCPILSGALKFTIEDLSNSLSEVIASGEETQNDDVRSNIITRRYLLDNLRYWLLAKESKDRCNLDIVPILYFYSAECPSCPNQGTILTHFKNLFGEQLLVFPINLDFRSQETMVEIVMNQFNITKYPTVVIDNKKYEGVVTQEQLQKIICQSLRASPNCPALNDNAQNVSAS
ncbi:MAG: conjugal transfer protein TraF [Nanoarchaeota archaeon]